MTVQLSPSIRGNQSLPSGIILDTAGLVSLLRSKTHLLSVIEADEDSIFQTVLAALTYENDAEIELAYRCLDIVRQYLGYGYHGNDYNREIADLANAIVEFGNAIYKELRRLKAYHNGYLFYQYMQLLSKDIVLVRIEPPPLVH